MKLTHLLEDRKELLKLQQRLIDGLPDDYDVSLASSKIGPHIIVQHADRSWSLKPGVMKRVPHLQSGEIAADRLYAEMHIKNDNWSGPWLIDNLIHLIINGVIVENINNSRTTLLKLQQAAIDFFVDDIDIELTTFRGREVITVSCNGNVYAFMPTPNDADRDHFGRDRALINASSIADLATRVSIFSTAAHTPVKINSDDVHGGGWMSMSNKHAAFTTLSAYL